MLPHATRATEQESGRKGKEGEWGRTRTESVYWIRIFSRFALCQTIFSPLFPANLSLAVGFCNQGFVCFYFGPFFFLRHGWLPELTFLLLDMPATCAWPWAVCLGLVRVRILDSPARGRWLCGLSLCCAPLSGSNAKGWPVGLLNMLRIDEGSAVWHPTHIYPPSKSYFGADSYWSGCSEYVWTHKYLSTVQDERKKNNTYFKFQIILYIFIKQKTLTLSSFIFKE